MKQMAQALQDIDLVVHNQQSMSPLIHPPLSDVDSGPSDV
jgi:hypothetical protein